MQRPRDFAINMLTLLKIRCAARFQIRAVRGKYKVRGGPPISVFITTGVLALPLKPQMRKETPARIF
jgi:hypothetical protein